VATTFVKISTVTVGSGGAANITFSSIPQTYTDLKIVLSARNTANDNACTVLFNGSSSDFTNKILFGNGSSPASNTPNTNYLCYLNFSTETASVFANSEAYIPNYTSSNFKSYSSDSAQENNSTTSYQILLAGLWSNTAAITSITLDPSSGDFAEYSTATLYGIKSS
jgi:hypothetical protein